MSAPGVILRADGSKRIGMGHIFRCCRLGRALKAEGFAPCLISREEEAVGRVAEQYQMELLAQPPNAPEAAVATLLKSEAARRKARVVIVDLLKSDTEVWTAVRACGARGVSLDERGVGLSEADLVINALQFQGERPRTRGKLFCGPEYLVMDEEVLEYRGKNRLAAEEPPRLLVSLGGSDAHGQTLELLNVLVHVEGEVRIEVVLGPAFGDAGALAAAADADPRVHILGTVPSLAPYLWESTMAIVVGGTTLFEAACLGSPAFALISEPHEAGPAHWAESQGFAQAIRPEELAHHKTLAGRIEALLADGERLLSMRRAGLEAVDGQGTARMVELIRRLVETP